MLTLSGADPEWKVALAIDRGWDLVLDCTACGVKTRKPARELPDATFQELSERLVCKCGKREGRLYTMQGFGGAFSTAG